MKTLDMLRNEHREFVDSCWDVYAAGQQIFLWLNSDGVIFHSTSNADTLLGVRSERTCLLSDILCMSMDDFISEHQKYGFIISILHNIENEKKNLGQIKILNHKLVDGNLLYFVMLRVFSSSDEELRECYQEKEPELIWAANKQKELVYLHSCSSGETYQFKQDELNSFQRLMSTLNPIYQNIFYAAVHNCQLDGNEFSLVVEVHTQSKTSSGYRYAKINGRYYRSGFDDIEIVGEMFLLNESSQYDRFIISSDEKVGRVIINSDSGEIFSCNNKAANLLGYDNPAEIIGSKYTEVFPNADDYFQVVKPEHASSIDFLGTGQYYRTLSKNKRLLNMMKSVKKVDSSSYIGSFVDRTNIFSDGPVNVAEIMNFVHYLSRFSANLISNNMPDLPPLMSEFRSLAKCSSLFICKRVVDSENASYEVVLGHDEFGNFEDALKGMDSRLMESFDSYLSSNQLVVSDDDNIEDRSLADDLSNHQDFSILIPLFNIEPDNNQQGESEHVPPPGKIDRYWGFIGFRKHDVSSHILSSTESEILRAIAFIISMLLRTFYEEKRKMEHVKLVLAEVGMLRTVNAAAVKSIQDSTTTLMNMALEQSSEADAIK